VEAVFKPDDERVSSLLQNASFGLDLSQLIFLDEIRFVKNFDSIELSIVLLTSKDDLTEGSLAQHSNDFEVVFGEFFTIFGDQSLGLVGSFLDLHVLLIKVLLELLGTKLLRILRRTDCVLHVLSFSESLQINLRSQPYFNWRLLEFLPKTDQIEQEIVSVQGSESIIVFRRHVENELTTSLRVSNVGNFFKTDLSLDFRAFKKIHELILQSPVTEVDEPLVGDDELSDLGPLPLIDLGKFPGPHQCL
jgi:hypothetical protein